MFAVVKANGRRRACLWSSRRVYADLNGAINIGLKFDRNLCYMSLDWRNCSVYRAVVHSIIGEQIKLQDLR